MSFDLFRAHYGLTSFLCAIVIYSDTVGKICKIFPRCKGICFGHVVSFSNEATAVFVNKAKNFLMKTVINNFEIQSRAFASIVISCVAISGFPQ